MTTPFNAATAAYGNAARLMSQSTRPQTDLSAAAGADFGKMLTESLQSVVDQGNRSDQMAMDMVNGKANVVDMVTAISETEMAVETMVTVRDRVISAYEEIMRMPI
jgi:flagellar hook-basal body complex protein FliE